MGERKTHHKHSHSTGAVTEIFKTSKGLKRHITIPFCLNQTLNLTSNLHPSNSSNAYELPTEYCSVLECALGDLDLLPDQIGIRPKNKQHLLATFALLKVTDLNIVGLKLNQAQLSLSRPCSISLYPASVLLSLSSMEALMGSG